MNAAVGSSAAWKARRCPGTGADRMKLRPVLLVILLLSGFYYVTTHGAATGKALPWLAGAANGSVPQEKLVSLDGSAGVFNLKEAAAAPAFDTEEQQNIGVYHKALPSVVNITFDCGGVRLF